MNAGLRSALLLAGGAVLLAAPLLLFGAAAAPPAGKPDATTAACQACHGAHGEGMAAAHVPRIAGQSADYLKKQLDDYADGTRDNPIMVNFAKPLSEKQRADVAARFAAMSAPFVAQAGSVNACYSCARPSIGLSGRRNQTRASLQQLPRARRRRSSILRTLPGGAISGVPWQCHQGVAGRDSQE